MTKLEMIDFIKRALPNLKVNHTYVNNDGWDNNIVIINRQTAFRFPKNNLIADKVLAEIKLLKMLKKQSLHIQVPEYEILFGKDGKLKCVYYTYIEGKSLSEYEFRVIPNQDVNAKILGNFLTKLHRINPNTLGEKLTTVHTLEYWENLYDATQKNILPYLNTYQKSEVTKTFSRFLDRFSAQRYPKTVIHGDLTASNIIFDHKPGKVKGIIDFTDAQISDPAFDFAGFYWNFGPVFTRKILSYYDGAESTEKIYERVQSFYGLQPVFHELLFAVQNGENVQWEGALKRFFVLKG